MQIFEAFNSRHQTRYFDHEKIPSKEFIENILYKTHELVPSKQNLMPYAVKILGCLLYTSPSPRDLSTSRMPSSA